MLAKDSSNKCIDFKPISKLLESLTGGLYKSKFITKMSRMTEIEHVLDGTVSF